MTTNQQHELRSLAAYRTGNLRLLLRSGSQIVRIDEDSAHRLRRAYQDDSPCDFITDGDFLTLDSARLDGMQWLADRSQPSPEGADARALRQRGGSLFLNGWLNALAEVAPPDATYSLAGLLVWKGVALLLLSEQTKPGDCDRGVLERIAKRLDGRGDPAEAFGRANGTIDADALFDDPGDRGDAGHPDEPADPADDSDAELPFEYENTSSAGAGDADLAEGTAPGAPDTVDDDPAQQAASPPEPEPGDA